MAIYPVLSRGPELSFALSLGNRKRARAHASMADGQHRSGRERDPVTFEDDTKKPGHLGTLEALLTDSDHGRPVMPPDRQASVEVGIEGDSHSVMLSAPDEDRLVGGGGEPDFAGMDGVDALATQQLSRSTRDTLIEEELHDAVGRSAFSSPTIAAA